MRKLSLFLAFSGVALAMVTQSPENPYVPDQSGVLEDPGLQEASGLARSRTVPGRWWSLNDSGHSNEIFPMTLDGKSLGAPVRILGAGNYDWEEICADEQGRLWIIDMGNNHNNRRDLMVYVVREPGVDLPNAIPVARKIGVRFPDQYGFPSSKMNFDCEAAFVRQGVLYVLTKHRSDLSTKLYRLDDNGGTEEQELTLLGSADDVGMVTGAALHPDGKRLAVLTYNGVWLFEAAPGSDRYLDGTRKELPMSLMHLRQCEGLDWLDERTLIICNEQRDLLRAPVSEFRRWP